MVELIDLGFTFTYFKTRLFQPFCDRLQFFSISMINLVRQRFQQRISVGVNGNLCDSRCFFFFSYLVILPYICFKIVWWPSFSRQNSWILLMVWFKVSALTNCLNFNALFKHSKSVIFRTPSLNSFLRKDILIQSIPLSFSLLLLTHMKPKITLSISFVQLSFNWYTCSP